MAAWERKRLLFLTKKKQKDFSPFSGPGAGYGRWRKVLWFFLSRKNNLVSSFTALGLAEG
jgi:hypothetical protein